MKSELLWGLVTSAIAGFFFWASVMFLSLEIVPESAVSAIVQIVAFFVIYDFYMYVTHRLLHTTWMSRFHARHHRAVAATPWSCLSMHPVEAVVNYLPFLFIASVLPMSLTVLFGLYVYLLLGIANGHSNYDLLRESRLPDRLSELIRFHQKHHSSPNGNYGYAYTHWDQVSGTRHLEPLAVTDV